ncbi:Scr1 family TA system antitoxin-like transcriptional regulator [Streptomyces sp. NPDC001275]
MEDGSQNVQLHTLINPWPTKYQLAAYAYVAEQYGYRYMGLAPYSSSGRSFPHLWFPPPARRRGTCFAGAGIEMVYVGGPLPRLDTVLRDAPHGTAFIDAESQLARFRALLNRVEKAALEPVASRYFIHHLTKEL